MTGFGRAEQTVNEKTFLVEIKALNGKQYELQLKLPPLLRPYEFDIRNTLQEQLLRGTIDCTVNIKQNGTSRPVNINTELIKAYYNQIEKLAGELHIDTNSVLSGCPFARSGQCVVCTCSPSTVYGSHACDHGDRNAFLCDHVDVDGRCHAASGCRCHT